MNPVSNGNPRLLIVDDIADNREVLARRFSKRGYDIVEADCGHKALELIGQQQFDLVLLDIMMPEMDGIEVLKLVRGNYSPDSLPVVMVTGKSFSDDVAGALELGANDYITKPVDFPVALARAQTQLARVYAHRAMLESNAQLVETNSRLAGEIAGRERSEAQVRYMTHHDGLTGLGNRTMLQEYLERALQRNAHSGSNLALIVLGADNFKLFAATFSQAAAETLWKQTAERLRDKMQSPVLDVVAGFQPGTAQGPNVSQKEKPARTPAAMPAGQGALIRGRF